MRYAKRGCVIEMVFTKRLTRMGHRRARVRIGICDHVRNDDERARLKRSTSRGCIRNAVDGIGADDPHRFDPPIADCLKQVDRFQTQLLRNSRNVPEPLHAIALNAQADDIGAALIGALCLSGFRINDPVVQRAGDRAPMHDALTQRPAFVGQASRSAKIAPSVDLNKAMSAPVACTMREPVCVEETADGQWQVRYYAMPLGVIDRNANRLTRKKREKPQTTPPETMLDDPL